MAAEIMARNEYRLIPGRLRISVAGLRRNTGFAGYLVQQLTKEAGIRSAGANPLTGRALIHFDQTRIGLVEIQRFISAISQSYFTPRPEGSSKVISAPAVKQTGLYALATGGVLAGLITKRVLVGRSPLASSPQVFNFVALATIISGYPVLRNGFHTLATKHKVNHDLVLFLAMLVLLAMRESITGLSVLWIVHLSNLFRLTMQARSNRNIANILGNKEQEVWRWSNGHKDLIKQAELNEGDIVLVHSGEDIPVDGQIVAGKAVVSQAAIAGSYLPQLKITGDAVFAGTRVQAGSVKVRADKVGNATSIAQITRMIKESQSRQGIHSPPEQYTGKFMYWALVIAGIVLFITRDFRRSLAVLLAGCPAAIALARSAALGTAAAQAAGRGIFIKDIEAIERAGQVDTVLFDKTGTITAALPRVAEIMTLIPGYKDTDVLLLAASAEKSTSHPLARMLVSEVRSRGLTLLSAENQSQLDYGIQAAIQGNRVSVGNHLLMERERIPTFRAKAKAMRLEHLGRSVLYVAVNRRLIGVLGISDIIKTESYEGVHRLRTLGITDIGVVTGDTSYAAEHICNELGLTAKWDSMLPAEKMKMVEKLKRSGKRIAMVGDGTNDSPAFTASDVSIVMGMSGTGEAVRTADIVLGSDDPRNVAAVIEIGRHTNEVIRQNLVLAAGFSVVGMALAAARFISPVTAGLLLNVSTLAVVLNSGRLLFHRGKRPAANMDLQRFAGKNSQSYPKAPPNNVVYLASTVAGQSSDNNWHLQAWSDACDVLETSPRFGLSAREAQERTALYGMNVLREAAKPSFWKMLGEQFKDFMVQVLLGAAGLCFVIGKTKDAFLTVGIVAANALLGVIQERKANSSLESLRKLSAPQARVIRGGRTARVPAESLVPGDVIVLEAGDRVPADVRLLTTSHFEVEESALTGEPLPVRKEAELICQQDDPIAERCNMAFMGTSVTRGRATAMVIATGMTTEMGKIASLIQTHIEEPTPLQRRLEELGKYLVYGCLGVSGLVFLTGLLRGERILIMLQTAASLAVAAIPEGLAAIVTIALAMGVQRMSRHNIIVRKLSSIETLGCATAICSDKTGTLTQNKMTVRELYTVDRNWQVTGEGYAPYGEFQLDQKTVSPLGNIELGRTLYNGVFCNDAKLMEAKPAGQKKVVSFDRQQPTGWMIDGDPTEGAMLVVAAKAGIRPDELENEHKRLKEFPFEAERQMMSVVCRQGENPPVLYCKGSPDKILSVSSHYVKDGQVVEMDEATRVKIEKANIGMAAKALRVLACAYRELPEFTGEEEASGIETGLIFCGLVGMIDPPRPEVPGAIAKCRAAGVKVIMITGDHPVTAKAIACELGISGRDGRVILGNDLERMSDEELGQAVTATNVYARTSPHQKLRIIKALKQKGYVVAMTGDGVNDAPAVKSADIGIAMGITGTDVTKQAASMTLADDNFATIVRAMEEGRSIYANIRKAIRYLVATNIGEVVLMLLAAFAGLPLPLIPIQLLWINLIGDGLPAIALVNDPPAKDIMNQPLKTADESVFSGGLGRKIITRGVIIGIASLALFIWKLARTGNLILARTLIVAQLAISQFIHIFDCRIERETGKVGLFSNPWLTGAVTVSMGMVGGIIYLPALHPVFGTTFLSGTDWAIATAIAGMTAVVDFGIGYILEHRPPQGPLLAEPGQL
ncbi:cation-translocating P-type ATPase [Lucifera butyrica]|uniref:cation-translocating P-type ATPase n=1 Tax=Lucifera butyrica TaxID=1351585 RepID=UPI001401CD36|nr:cation-translocating P-type ATPase [Lucifera butyrica]